MTAEEKRDQITKPGIYSFQVPDKLPRVVVQELFTHIHQDFPDTGTVEFTPAHMRENGEVYPPRIDKRLWRTLELAK